MEESSCCGLNSIFAAYQSVNYNGIKNAHAYIHSVFTQSDPVPAPQVHLQTQQEVKSRMTGMVIQVVRSDGVLALYSGLSASLCRQVHLQTQQEVKSRMTGMVIQVVRSDGVLALYSGLSASLCRQVHLQTQQEVKSRMTGMVIQVVRSDGVLALYSGLSASLCRQVHLQTQQEVKSRMTGMVIQVVRSDGVLALYSGLSASLCRQMTYSLTRFAIYETVRDRISSGSQAPLPFYQKVLLGAFGGDGPARKAPTPREDGSDFDNEPHKRRNQFLSVLVALGAMIIFCHAILFQHKFSRRLMQNDVKLPAHLRRNYAHALDGLYRVWHEEGLRRLFSGATMASSRGALVTVGQLSCYDQAKQAVLSTGILSDNIFTHFLASFIARERSAVSCCESISVWLSTNSNRTRGSGTAENNNGSDEEYEEEEEIGGRRKRCLRLLAVLQHS
ncbi:UNVERIFIED_CONTAM: hypothetical protein FKN15_046857 [Acipenser sinensis]